MIRARPRTCASSRPARGLLLILALVVACAESAPNGTPLGPPAAVKLDAVTPLTILPGTRLLLEGSNFNASVTQRFRLAGSGPNGHNVDLTSPVTVLDPEQAELEVGTTLFDRVGEGSVKGEVSVDSENVVGVTPGHKLPVTLELKQHLDPMVTDVGDGLVHLNSRVSVLGDGFLLGSQEGESVVELDGCFLPDSVVGDCQTGGTAVRVELPLTPKDPTDRRAATFEFSPKIAGLLPGKFEGKIAVVNRHADSTDRRSSPVSVTFQLGQTLVHRIDQSAVSLGQYMDIRGAGFVGSPDGSTLIHFEGSFTPKGGQTRQVTFDLVPGYKNGGWLRDVAAEGTGIGDVVKLRSEHGVLDGTWTPTVFFQSKSAEGLPIKLSVTVAPVKQVVWVRYTTEWQEGLRLFGLQAADSQIRARILEVMRQVYLGINVDFREEEPQDFKLYAKVDLGGEDPNGLGLLGYDNTPGKDVENQRLYDWLGGVNALTQQDGYPGYGGVFLESTLGFSEHPPAGILKSPLKSPLFDALFDPFRPDRGNELTAAESLAAGTPSSMSGCPAVDRVAQARCAMRALGNVVGSTSAHELGHSLGLADPYGSPTEFHNPGDKPNRLMESGQGRPFEERAELNGKGPAVFCDEEFLYLKKILPLDPPQDPAIARPDCY